jgi:hypothetical protein
VPSEAAGLQLAAFRNLRLVTVSYG